MPEPAPQRFRITHEGDTIGSTLFEGGDPDSRSVSGRVYNMGGAEALASWIRSIGGAEDDGAVYIELNTDFRIEDGEGNDIPFDEATLISVPSDGEAFIDVSGISGDQYSSLFAHHVDAALNG